MNSFFDIHVALPLVALLTAVFLSSRVWKFRRRAVPANFLILMLCLVIWSFSAIMEYASSTLAGKTFWIYFTYFGIVPLSIVWLFYCLRYANKAKWINLRNVVVLSILPAITLVLVWTNGANHLMWKDIWINSAGSHPIDEVIHGPWFWVFASYSYSLLALGTVNLISLMRKSTGLYRSQISVMVLGTFVPWLGNALFLIVPSMFASVDPTPLAFAITGVLFYVGMSRFHLMEVTPVARDAIFNSICEAVIVLDIEKRVVDLNPAARRILVPDFGDVMGVPLAALFPQFSPGTLIDNRQKHSITIGQEADEHTFEVAFSEIKSQNHLNGYLIILHDITERNKADEAMRERVVLETELAERKKAAEIIQYRLYLEQTIAGISSRFATATDLDEAINESLSDIGYLGKASRAYFYRTSEDGLSMSNTHEWCADGIASKKRNLQNLPVTQFKWWVKKLSNGETILIPDCSKLPPEATAEKILMESQEIQSVVALPVKGNGSVFGFIGLENLMNSSSWTEKDLSVLRMSAEIIGSAIERDEAAHQLAELNSQLEGRVEERTRQLEEAVVEANSANQAKSNFLASMSHELRTPLNAIIGFSQVLDEQIFGQLNDKQAEYIINVLSSGQHLLCLINDILDLSKIEAGKSQLELSDARIAPLINDSLLMIKEKAANKRVELVTKISSFADASELMVDTRKIKQILFNLLSNAVKFTPDDGKISVMADRNDGHISVSVSDSGIGIPLEAQSKLFTDFYQVQGGLLSKTPGTGLGLAISKRLVEMHGGNIWVNSDGTNKGATFAFEIPVTQQKGEEN